MRNATCHHNAVRTPISNHTSYELFENETSSHPNWLTATVWIRSAPDLLDTFTTEHSTLSLGLTEQCSFAELTTRTGTGTPICLSLFLAYRLRFHISVRLYASSISCCSYGRCASHDIFLNKILEATFSTILLVTLDPAAAIVN